MVGSVQFSSVTQSHPSLCNHMDRSTPGLPVHHQLLEFSQTHVHWVSDAIQPSQPLSSPSPPAFNLSQHQHSINSSLKWLHLSRSPLRGSTFLRLLVSNYSDETFSQLHLAGLLVLVWGSICIRKRCILINEQEKPSQNSKTWVTLSKSFEFAVSSPINIRCQDEPWSSFRCRI